MTQLQSFLTMMDRNRIAMDAENEITKPSKVDRPRHTKRGLTKYPAEQAMARELWPSIRPRMTRQEAARQVASMIRKRTGNGQITESKVVGWARRGMLE